MDFTSFKRAAKRLHKFAPSYFGDGQQHWQLADSQTLLARVHNFRDFHEAEVALSRQNLLSTIRADAGGLQIPIKPLSNPVQTILQHSGDTLAIAGQSGRGKTFLACEIIVQALALGRRIRVVDCGRGLERFASLLGGISLKRPDREVWQSSAALVVLEAEDMHRQGQAVDFKGLAMEGDTLFLCDEYWQFHDAYQHPGCQTILLSMNAEDFGSREPDSWIRNEKGQWTWYLAGGGKLSLVMGSSPWREAVYSFKQSVTEELGMTFDRERFEAFVARKNILR